MGWESSTSPINQLGFVHPRVLVQPPGWASRLALEARHSHMLEARHSHMLEAHSHMLEARHSHMLEAHSHIHPPQGMHSFAYR